MSKSKIKRLYWDIEVTPNLVYSWNVGWKQSISYENIKEERKIICICYKWEGEKKIHSLVWDENQDDKQMLIDFIKIANEADELVGQNSDKFDEPWVRSRCVLHRIEMFPHYTTLDTLQKAKRRFRFNSNRLDYLGKVLLGSGKIKTDFNLWLKVMDGDEKALAKMIRYCKGDIRVLEGVYKVMSPYIKNNVNHAKLQGKNACHCPECASSNVVLSKYRTTLAGTVKTQLQCKDCRKYFTIRKSEYDKFFK